MAAPGILYEVNVAVSPDIRDAYLAWLRPHIEKMLTFDGFIGASVFVDTENENRITAHYILRDQNAINSYLNGPADGMRADGAKRFGDKISATRRILTAKIL